MFAALGALALCTLTTGTSPTPAPQATGGLAVRAAKALTSSVEGPGVIDDVVLLVRDGRIEAIGSARNVTIPDDYEVVDVGTSWIAPGLVELHAHIAGSFQDLNDMVYLTNPGLRAKTAVRTDNSFLRRGLAGGVTTVLYIPGSGTNVGGQGILLKTGFEGYEESVLRDPGSLKLAQAGNPEGHARGVGRSFMNWNTRNTFLRGVRYAKQWEEHEAGRGPAPEKNPQWEIYRALYGKEAQISTHTQIYQVVLMTITMIRKELGLDVFIDHGTFNGYRAGGIAQEAGVPAILGPRNVDAPSWLMQRFAGTNPEKVQGVAAGYQEHGHRMIGFNTDSPVIPQEELSLQAAIGIRYGLDATNMEGVRGLTIVPAQAAGIADRVGSLEVGKHADVLVLTGDPADPRTSIETVFIEGRRVYDAEEHGRRW